MRKPKAIIFDGGVEMESPLKQFLDARSYETMVVMQPRFCPVYGKEGSDPSTCYRLCSDIMIIVENDPPMYGARLLAAQFRHGCSLTPRNKAIISNMLTDEERNVVKAMEGTVFHSPLDFDEFDAWIQGCRKRMDLSKPLAIKRRAPRQACSMDMEVRYRVLSGGSGVDRARALNMSLCGMCIKTHHNLKPRQVIHMWSTEPPLSEDAEVRWIRQIEDGTYLIGLTFCVV